MRAGRPDEGRLTRILRKLGDLTMRHVTKIARNARPLTEDEIRRFAPSIFAEDKHESRSEKYTYIPTIHVLRALSREGFLPVHVRQSRTRDESRQDFTKHMVRFRREGEDYTAVGDTRPEIVLVNSHDGTSSYHLDAGLFRLVCLNGLVVDAGSISTFRVPHKGDVIGQVIEGSYRVIGESVRALEAPREWSHLAITEGERQVFAEAAHHMRFADAAGEVTTPVKPAQLLAPRRTEDTKRDLWTTFNVIQENVIKGGIHATRYEQGRRPRRTTTREVGSIDADVKLNKALWILAEGMAKLKAA
jgi:hypothetical protein